MVNFYFTYFFLTLCDVHTHNVLYNLGRKFHSHDEWFVAIFRELMPQWKFDSSLIYNFRNIIGIKIWSNILLCVSCIVSYAKPDTNLNAVQLTAVFTYHIFIYCF